MTAIILHMPQPLVRIVRDPRQADLDFKLTRGVAESLYRSGALQWDIASSCFTSLGASRQQILTAATTAAKTV